jgi:carbon-monoxide dehydrogenase small subunit
MLMASQDWLRSAPTCSRSAIREHLSGNYCRCTGYEAIVDAVINTAALRRKKEGA